MTTTTILRKKGQFTIPVALREKLDMEENDVITILPWGEKGFIVVPKKLKTVELLKETEALAKAHGVTLEEMLMELDKIRHAS